MIPGSRTSSRSTTASAAGARESTKWSWEHGVEADYPWRSGKILWCAFHYKSIAEGAGLQGLADYWRMPRSPYHWYREKLRGIAPPAFPEPGTAVALRLTSDTEEIPTDGTGDARLVVELLD